MEQSASNDHCQWNLENKAPNSMQTMSELHILQLINYCILGKRPLYAFKKSNFPQKKSKRNHTLKGKVRECFSEKQLLKFLGRFLLFVPSLTRCISRCPSTPRGEGWTPWGWCRGCRGPGGLRTRSAWTLHPTQSRWSNPPTWRRRRHHATAAANLDAGSGK